MTTEAERQAYEQGRANRARPGAPYANPYVKNTRLWRAFEAGWDDEDERRDRAAAGLPPKEG